MGRILIILAGATLVSACEDQKSDVVEAVRYHQVYEGTLRESCGDHCHGWSETDNDIGPIGRDGLRVYIEPSFDDFALRFEILPQPSGCAVRWDDAAPAQANDYCTGFLVRMRKLAISEQGAVQLPMPRDYSFLLPSKDSNALFSIADRSLDRWRGSTTISLDGTDISLELHKNGRTRSLSSNEDEYSEPTDPAAQVGAELRKLVRAYGPKDGLPRFW